MLSDRIRGPEERFAAALGEDDAAADVELANEVGTHNIVRTTSCIYLSLTLSLLHSASFRAPLIRFALCQLAGARLHPVLHC